jgi:hypothetical protein
MTQEVDKHDRPRKGEVSIDVCRKAQSASRKEKEWVECFERATEAGTKVYDVKTHMCAKFERRRRHDIRRSSGLDDPCIVGDVCVIWRCHWHTRLVSFCLFNVTRDTFEIRCRQFTNSSINTFWARRRLACTPLEDRSPWAWR